MKYVQLNYGVSNNKDNFNSIKELAAILLGYLNITEPQDDQYFRLDHAGFDDRCIVIVKTFRDEYGSGNIFGDKESVSFKFELERCFNLKTAKDIINHKFYFKDYIICKTLKP